MSSKVISIEEEGLPAFQESHKDRAQLLVFTAPWCGPCRSMAPTVEDVAEESEATAAVGRICIDSSPRLAAQFAVKAVPTLVVMKDGKELARSFGVLSRTRLIRLLNTALDGATE